MSPQLQKHIAEGGLAAVLEPSVGGGELVLVDRAGRWPVTSVEAIPATLGGKAAFNIANALAACLIGRGLGVPIDTIAAALADFRSSFEDNPGRMNVHEAHGFKVIVDYAHNPAGLRALGEVIAELRPSHRSVIGTASIPGDRRDDDIRQMGALAAELFDYVVFRERPDGRGRPPGEVLSLLYEGAISTGKPKARIECIEAERPAILACLARARPGDLVVLLPTKVEDCWRLVTEFRPQGGKVRAERSAHA